MDFLSELQEAHDRDVRNPSLAYSLKATQDDALMLSNAREYDRGYQDGKRARGADEWRLSNDRREAASRLKKWQPDEDGRPHRELWEAVMGQYLPVVAVRPAVLNTMLRDQLVYLLGANGHVDGRRGMEASEKARGLEQSLENVKSERDALLAMVRSLEEGSIPATEENMERCGWVPKKVVDEANDRMDDLRDLVDALKSTIAWQNKELARLKKEDE